MPEKEPGLQVETQDVDVEIEKMDIRAARTLKVYREDGSAIDYSSDVTDHRIVAGCTIPMTVKVAGGLQDKDLVMAVIEQLSDMVSETVALAAELKTQTGVKLPVTVAYGANSPKKKVEGI